MKENKDMKDTNRIAFKTDFGGKFYVDKINVDGKERYIITTNDLDLSAADVTEFDTMVCDGIEFEDDLIRIGVVVLKNVALRTIYFNNDGFIDKYISSYSPMKEEKINSKLFSFNVDNIVEISADLELFDEMIRSDFIKGSTINLAKYGLYYPQLRVVKNKTLAKSK